jgi:hypothetical protein
MSQGDDAKVSESFRVSTKLVNFGKDFGLDIEILGDGIDGVG